MSCGKMKSLLFLVISILVVHESFGNENPIPGLDEYIIMKPRDCKEVQQFGRSKSGVYNIWVKDLSGEKRLKVYCDMDTDGGGWTVLQRRGDYSTPNDYFYQGWYAYKEGFGNLKEEFWLGNENIHQLSNQKNYSIRFDLRSASGKEAYAQYDKFLVQNETRKYRLYIDLYTGNAGDRMKYHNVSKFSTWDRDNDDHNYVHCAQDSKGGWWYYFCHEANLNGLRGSGGERTVARWDSFDVENKSRSLEHIEMKIRPR